MKGKRIVGLSFVPRCTCSYKVSLGDYVLPPDKRMEHLQGIPRCSSAEYTEPYETSKLVHAIRREGGGGGGGSRKSSPLEDKPSGYSLARSVGPVRTEPSVLHRTLSEPSGGTPEDDNSAVYDHLVTWKLKESVSPRSPTSPRTPVIPQYEDPWDSRGKQEQFNQICEKADLVSRKSQPTSPTSPNKPSQRMDVYEEAWDSNFKQKQLDAKLMEARRASESKPKGRYEYEEPMSSISTKKSSPVMNRSSQNSEQVYSSNYEQPWDSKQKELEERFSRVGMSGGQVPPGSPPPPDFAPPPPPQTYEEAWDIRPHSKIISQVSSTPKAPDHPPPRRTSPQLSQSIPPSQSKSLAEPIDPKLPLDIQKFYHGGITRKVAEDMLRVHKEGSYLVRRSETQKNVFSLSLKGVGGIPMHLRISLSQGEYVLGENSQPFPTVPEMVAYYTRHDLPVQNASHIKLLHPIARP
ncbi:SH2 domain-containing adapter protein B-like isoform X3 [Crassostrea angulata]|uniref:SH2 domain-containing adapter protein B-like isoform X3 n=1 Tax=Magallana angulata TaxID=2784310 RepID=UPI0005C3BDEA|nr:SH2 domain-containing adapter protein B-like isoform X3 [Crassostrea angulata]|eukprot:XP_011449612.1 PREDICTED: SH2 domain-containing adapter protein B isoform X3 [Crassostrea gigas]